ncbi:DNA repair protein complementing XP-G cells-like [Anopheles albimanus]|uniref:DNA repair protein complementing XP-G cells n=1 Tax=Anopheles albimanus TaxID=7167 RepID=A0A182F1I4_ANOAL|nr:DNA repair protein complementing XP-G cells-like [Anopheles albimanus]
MGVLGLWKLIEQSGKPVPLETLENKVLAVDVSIWLHQVIKGFQDSKGSALPNAHVLGLFHRLCKLMFYRIKPIFVFDGGVPVLKKQTIAKRNQSRNNYQNEADRIQQLLLETLAKEKVVQQALGSATNILITPSKKPLPAIGGSGSKQQQEEEPDAMFKLPPMKLPEEPIDLDKSDSSMDEKASRNYYHLNLNAIDVTSVYFKNLPADVRHEILNDIKETRKQSSWGRLHELPVQSDSFSSFQMTRLLKRRQVQVELEEAEKEMGGKCLSLAELESLLNEEGVATSSSRAAQQIASDENTRFLLVRDVQKAIEKAKAREEEEKLAPKPPKVPKLVRESGNTLVDDDKEMDEELQMAIKMSLMQDENPTALIELDDEDVRMSRQQKQVLGSAARSLARGFMLEYGGLTNEEFNELLHQTQDVDCGDVNDSMSQMFVYNDVSVIQPAISAKSIEEEEPKKQLTVSEPIAMADKSNSESETESDSDFIDVPSDISDDSAIGVSLPLNKTNHQKPHFNPIVDLTIDDLAKYGKGGKSEQGKSSKQVVEVIIKKEQIGVCDEDDIFADVFMEGKPTSNEVKTSNPTPPMAPKETPEEVPIVVKPMVGLKIKKVDDINAQLKEQLEQLRKAPPVLDLEGIVPASIEALPGPLTADNVTIASSNPPTDLKSIHETLKQQLAELKTSAITLDLNGIDLEATVKDKQPATEDEMDSDATIICETNSPNATILSPTKSINEAPIENLKSDIAIPKMDDDVAIISQKPTVIEILDSPTKKGTLEHLIIARTPGKDSEKKQSAEKDENIPNVAKPFFVNKTPPSAKKVSSSEGATEGTSAGSSVVKQLFPKIDETEAIPSTSKGLVPAKPPVNAETLITEMASSLKDSRTPLELKQMALDLAQNERELEREKNKQNRLGVSITDQMRNDCMELLQLFGVPYIVAPMEAEAQCAFLNQIEITDGTITDDSDIWLFGGQKVYKNFFNQQKLVLEFTIEGIEQAFQMDRKKLIQLALLVGSDYTTGIHGIGAVTALEILASFPPTPEQAGETSELMSMLSGLRKFRDWWQHSRNGAATTGTRIALKSKLKNIEIGEGFPNSGVVEAYLKPTVDCSEEEFTWGYPDADRLRDYARQKFGWTRSKTDDILLPVLKRLDERKSQASIKNYFKVQSAVAQSRVKVSKRVQYAVDTMAGKIDPGVEESKTAKKKSPAKKGGRKKKPEAQASTTTADSDETVVLGSQEGIGVTEPADRSADTDDAFAEKQPKKKPPGRKKGAAAAAGTSNPANDGQKAKRGRKKAVEPAQTAESASEPSENTLTGPKHSLANIGGIIANINSQSANSLNEETTGTGRAKRGANKIPDFNPAIPQRVKDEQEMAERKQKAAALFKKLRAEGTIKGRKKGG